MLFSSYSHVGILFALSVPLVWAFTLVSRPAGLVGLRGSNVRLKKNSLNTLFLRLMLSLSFGTVGLSFYLSYSLTATNYKDLLFIWGVFFLTLTASILYHPVFFNLTEKLKRKASPVVFLSVWFILTLILIPLSLAGFYTITEKRVSVFQVILCLGIAIISVLLAFIGRYFFKDTLLSNKYQLTNNNRFLCCTPDVIKEAFLNNQIEFLYQPVFNATWQIQAFGIKIYRHTKLGQISENEFIKSLEQANLMPEMIHYMLEKNCRAASFWPEYLSLYLNVNYIYLRDETFLSSLEQACKKNSFAPSRLILEISYDAFSLLPEALFIRLKELGVFLVLGQFRGEHEEIRLLENFQPWGVKLAPYLLFTLRSLHQQQEKIPKALNILRIAKEKNLKVFASNIAGLRTLKCLKENGCDYFAGPLFKAPVSEENILPLLHHNNSKEPKELRPSATTEEADMLIFRKKILNKWR